MLLLLAALSALLSLGNGEIFVYFLGALFEKGFGVCSGLAAALMIGREGGGVNSNGAV